MTLHYCTVYERHIQESIGLYRYCTNASKKLVTEAIYSPLTTPPDVVVTQPQVSAMLQPLAMTAEVSAQLHQASLSAAATCLHSMTKRSRIAVQWTFIQVLYQIKNLASFQLNI